MKVIEKEEATDMFGERKNEFRDKMNDFRDKMNDFRGLRRNKRVKH